MTPSEMVISAHADYRREDYIHPRTQSRTMAALEWENRTQPRFVRWVKVLFGAVVMGALMVGCFAAAVFMVLVLS